MEKVVQATRFDKGMLPYEIELTEEGYIQGRCIVTRCGVFLYKNADGSIRRELRETEEVTHPDSMATIKMIPVVDGHPVEKLVNADNVKRLAVGYTGETIEDEYPYLIANVKITDKATVDKIKNNEKNQLSLGYTVDLVQQDGIYEGEPYDYIQKNIRYNHLAIVDEARAGPAARIALDGNDAEEIYKEEAGTMASKKLRKVKIDTSEYMVDDDAATSIEKLMEEKAALEAKIKAMQEGSEADSQKPENEPLERKAEDEVGENGKEIRQPFDANGMSSHVRDYQKPSQMEPHPVESPKNAHYPNDLPHVAKVDHAEINRRVKNRVNLIRKAEAYLDKSTLSRLDSMSDIDVKKKVILSVYKSAQLDDKEESYIHARFDSILESRVEQGTSVIANPVRVENADEKDRADATASRMSMIKRQKDGYKQVMRGR